MKSHLPLSLVLYLSICVAPAPGVEPGTLTQYLKKGDAELAKKNYAGAESYYHMAVRAEPKSAEAHLARAESLYKLGKLAFADREVSLAIGINPRLAKAYYIRCLIFES